MSVLHFLHWKCIEVLLFISDERIVLQNLMVQKIIQAASIIAQISVPMKRMWLRNCN